MGRSSIVAVAAQISVATKVAKPYLRKSVQAVDPIQFT